MKKLISILVLLLSTSAFAYHPAQFIGKYELSGQNCSLMKQYNMCRAYISFINESDGSLALLMQFYGDEARKIIVKLGEGSRKPLGVSSDYHDDVTETWKSEFINDHELRSVTKTDWPRKNYKSTQYEYLILQGKALTYKSFERINASKDSRIYSCKMLRVR